MTNGTDDSDETDWKIERTCSWKNRLLPHLPFDYVWSSLLWLTGQNTNVKSAFYVFLIIFIKRAFLIF